MRNLSWPPLTLPSCFACLSLLKVFVPLPTQVEKVDVEKHPGAFGLWTVTVKLRMLVVQKIMI